jgi:hypothetical protein
MAVLMFENIVLMLVAVAFVEMQPETQPGERQLQGRELMHEPDRDERADKGASETQCGKTHHAATEFAVFRQMRLAS